MPIRPLLPTDLSAIAEISTAYSTDHVWQMEQKINSGEIVTSFRAIRLPRELRVLDQPDKSWIEENWQKSDLFIVAEEGGEIAGYLELNVNPTMKNAVVANLAVSFLKRRKGIAIALLREAQAWGRGRKLRSLIIETQTKNYPTICLSQKLGFTFCGFNDSYYPNKDIAVFFVLPLG